MYRNDLKFATIIRNSRPYKDNDIETLGTITFEGIARKSSDPNYFVLIINSIDQQKRNILEININDVKNYEVLRQTSVGDKIIRISVTPETNIRQISYMPARRLNYMANPFDSRTPFVLSIPHVLSKWKEMDLRIRQNYTLSGGKKNNSNCGR